MSGRASLPNADDHLAITDALLRFAAGVDEGEAALIESAFADDAEIDFAPCGAALGLEFGVVRGREVIVDFLAGTAVGQATSHVVSNARTTRDGEAASLVALVDAVHIARADRTDRFRMMNRYEARLVGRSEVWVLRRVRIVNVWFEGDPRVLLSR